MAFTGTIKNNRKISTENGKSQIKPDFNFNAMNSSTGLTQKCYIAVMLRTQNQRVVRN